MHFFSKPHFHSTTAAILVCCKFICCSSHWILCSNGENIMVCTCICQNVNWLKPLNYSSNLISANQLLNYLIEIARTVSLCKWNPTVFQNKMMFYQFNKISKISQFQLVQSHNKKKKLGPNCLYSYVLYCIDKFNHDSTLYQIATFTIDRKSLGIQ